VLWLRNRSNKEVCSSGEKSALSVMLEILPA
jgi:hypothetical protein